MSKILVFIDPGHGGEDRGAQYFGMCEADLTLEIARCVRRACDSTIGSIDVCLTRDSDISMSLTERGEASRSGDLVISLHLNANSDGAIFGPRAYLWPGSLEARGVAEDLIMCSHSPKNLRNRISEVRRYDPLGPDSWRNRAYNVVSSFWPQTVLFEALFISNSKEAGYVESEQGRSAVALSIAQALARYAQRKIKTGDRCG